MTAATTPAARDLALELSQLEERRATLSAELEAAQAALRTAREGLVAGHAKVGAVEAAQNRVNALSGAVDDLDATLGGVRRRLESAQAAEAREAYLTALLDLAHQAQAKVQEHEQNRRELLVAARPFLDKQASILQDVVATKTRFVQLAESHGGLDRATLDELRRRGAVLHPLLIRWVSAPSTQFDRDGPHPLPPITVGDATQVIIRP